MWLLFYIFKIITQYNLLAVNFSLGITYRIQEYLFSLRHDAIQKSLAQIAFVEIYWQGYFFIIFDVFVNLP